MIQYDDILIYSRWFMPAADVTYALLCIYFKNASRILEATLIYFPAECSWKHISLA